MTRPARCFAWLLLTLAGVATLGCDGTIYVLHLAQGQLGIAGQSEPIDDVLASGRLAEDDDAKLRLIVQARQFAVETIGLRAGSSYTTFYDTAGDPLAFNLSAARHDALVPKTWTFPIVGEVPYISFFDEGYLRRVERQLQADGYDTFTYELDAYSTLGVFEDPVRSPMLRRDELSLAETIIHELLHNTIYRSGATTFNESLATFIGRTAAVEFLRQEYGEESGWPLLATRYYADLDAANSFLIGLYDELATYYAQPLSREEKIAGREAIFQAARERFSNEVQPRLNYPAAFGGLAGLPTNNAWVLANYRYNLSLDVFAAVHAATGGAWPASLAVFRAAAAAPGDPFQYLRDWLAAQAG